MDTGMSVLEISALIAALAAFGGLIVSVLNAIKIKEVHTTTNSKMDLLITEIRKSALAEGVKLGHQEANVLAAAALADRKESEAKVATKGESK